MPFSVKDWRDSPDTTTPLNAAALEDMETRLSGYSDDVVTPESWTAVTFQNSWVNHGTTLHDAAYTKLPNGLVLLRGAIKNTNTLTFGTVMFTLPAGYRPSARRYRFPVWAQVAGGPVQTYLDVASDGTCFTGNPSSEVPTLLSLDGAMFFVS